MLKIDKNQAQPVLVLHGLWTHAPMMRWLTTRLRSNGWDARAFGYYSLLQDTPAALDAIAQRLRERPGAHVVAHSLGGLLAVRALSQHQDLTVGRLVCLGSPLAGSKAAATLAQRLPGGEKLVGQHLTLLKSGVTVIPPGREVGMVAGCKRRGLGRIIMQFDCDNDGTVALPETIVPGLTDHVVVPISHSGLIYSSQAAARAMEFLRDGRFGHADESMGV